MNEADIEINLPQGLVGFSQLIRFRLFEPSDSYPLKFLQAIEEPDIAFVCMDPAGIKPDYTVPLSDEQAAFLAIERPEDALVLTLVVIPEDPRYMTTNLAGPIVINVRTYQGIQVALSTDQYPLQYPILGER